MGNLETVIKELTAKVKWYQVMYRFEINNQDFIKANEWALECKDFQRMVGLLKEVQEEMEREGKNEK